MRPREHSADWPDAPCSDPDAEVIRRVALNLRTAIGDRSLRAAADATGVDHSVIHDILAGNSWPEVVTIARLARGLGVHVWPDPGR